METTDKPFQPYTLKDLGEPWTCVLAPQSTIHTPLPVQCSYQFLPQKPNFLSIVFLQIWGFHSSFPFLSRGGAAFPTR